MYIWLGMGKYQNKPFNQKNFKSEFILACIKPAKKDMKTLPWAREMKIMLQLIEKCPDPDFWYHARPDFELPSLAWFLTDNGRKYLNEKYLRFTSDISTKREEVILGEFKESENLSEKENPKPKIKTLKDFLKM